MNAMGRLIGIAFLLSQTSICTGQGDRVAVLIGELESPEMGVRLDAVEDLNGMHDPRIEDALIHELNDPSDLVRNAVVKDLGQCPDPRVVKALIDRLEIDIYAPHDWNADAEADALGKIGVLSLAPLIERLQGTRPLLRVEAARALSQIDDSRAARALLATLPEHNLLIISAAAKFFMRQNDPASQDALVKLIETCPVHWDLINSLLNSNKPKIRDAAQAWAKRENIAIKKDASGIEHLDEHD